MIKNIVKSIIRDNVPLVICMLCCLIFGNFVILYELSFSYKITANNYNSTYYVQTENSAYQNIKNEISRLRATDYEYIYYSVGNGLACGKYNSMIDEGRKPIKSNEVLAEYAMGYDVGTKVVYNGVEYTVVGLATLPGFDVLIDDEYNDCSSFMINEVLLNANVKVARKKIISELSLVFPNSVITAPQKIGIKQAFTTTPIFLLVIAIVFISIFTFALIIRYLLTKAFKPMMVYLLLGFPAEKIIMRLLLFVFLTITSAVLFNSIVYSIAEYILSINAKTFMSNVVLSFSDYLIVYASMLFLCYIMLIPTVIRLMKKSVGYKYV